MLFIRLFLGPLGSSLRSVVSPKKLTTECTERHGNRKGGPFRARLFCVSLSSESNYFAFGVVVAVGFTSLLTFFSSGFLTSGVVPGLAGDATGEATGLATGLTIGVTTVFGFVTVALLGALEHAPTTATDAAKTDDKTNDLLIVFLLSNLEHGTGPSAGRHPQPE